MSYLPCDYDKVGESIRPFYKIHHVLTVRGGKADNFPKLVQHNQRISSGYGQVAEWSQEPKHNSPAS